MPTFTRNFDSITPADVAGVEKRLGVTFPAEYRQFLLITNGGCPEPNVFAVPDRGDAMVGVLYGIRGKSFSCDLEYEFENATMWRPLPPGIITVGSDPGGNQLLLETLGRHAGRLLFWDRTGIWVRDDGQNTFPIADTFTALLDSLTAVAG